MKIRRIVALGLAIMTAMSMGTMAFAAPLVETANTVGDSPVVLTAEGVQFKATLPLAFPFTIDQEGVVTVSDNLVLHNQSAAPIIVTEGKVNLGTTGWTLNDYDLSEVEHYSNLKVNSPVYGFILNETKADAETGVMDVNSGTWAVIGSAGFDAEAVEANTLPMIYNGKFAPQATAQEALTIGHVELTLDFDKVD